MSSSPSPTSSPLLKASNDAVHNPPVSNPTMSENSATRVQTKRPSIAFAGADDANVTKEGRRASIQFAPSADAAARPIKPRVPPLSCQKRMSSPPPPSTYEARVSFDTFDNRGATDISFTLVSKHKDYIYTRRSRTFLCGTDQKDYSEFALEWLVEELVEDGDEIVCLRVVDKESKIASDPSVQQGIYKAEARSLLKSVQRKNEDGKAISVVLELAVGKVPETIQRMIQIYAPTCLIVGTRGRSLGGISGLLPGSVSKYCLQNSLVPVVVVRPEDKREKKKAKRLANPTRQGYSSILVNATASGEGVSFDAVSRHQRAGEASDGEAQAVAKAIGLKERATGSGDGMEGAPLSRTVSVKSEAATEDSPSPTGPLVIDDEGLEEVPKMELLGEPVLSETEREDQKKEDVPELQDLGVTEKIVDKGKDDKAEDKQTGSSEGVQK